LQVKIEIIMIKGTFFVFSVILSTWFLQKEQ